VLFFTSHFYTKLVEGGPELVARWTKDKDVFTKRLIIVPIEMGGHWSICVVVNPGSILEHIKVDATLSPSAPCPCLIFMDSMKCHNKDAIGTKMRTWLNSEWRVRVRNERPGPHGLHGPLVLVSGYMSLKVRGRIYDLFSL
jgi:sentrin-specific protease 7